MSKQDHTYISVQLIHGIANSNNAQVKSILNEKLAQAHDDFGTLLHYSAQWDNGEIAQNLLRLGANVDSIGRDGKTPLMLAAENDSLSCIEVLMNANANIYIVDVDGQNVLRYVLENDLQDWDSSFEQIFNEPQTESCTAQELAERLISAGCNMCHATKYRNIKLMKCMLEKGIGIDSRNSKGDTALHAAAELNDINLIEWLLNNGSDVNALDGNNNSTLLLSGYSGSKVMIKILLEHGADPNFIGPDGHTTLFIIFDARSCRFDKEYFKCVEYLLQYGGIPLNFNNADRTWFDCVIDCLSSKGVEMIIELLVMFGKLGTPITKSITHCPEHQSDQLGYEKYFDLCEQVLEIVIFGKLSIIDLIRMTKYKIKQLVRNETFVSTVKEFCSENCLNQSLPYCFAKIMNRLDKADRIVKLEDKTILVICKLFRGNYNQCYTFARKVVDYLKLSDLENMAEVF